MSLDAIELSHEAIELLPHPEFLTQSLWPVSIGLTLVRKIH